MPNLVVHFEIHGSEPQQLVDFYTELLGWKFTEYGGGEQPYWTIETGEGSDTATLADLARWTGGDLRISSVPAHTVEGLADLFTELRHQYVITFEPGKRPGWHPLEIRTRKKNLAVRARSGYMTSPARVGS